MLRLFNSRPAPAAQVFSMAERFSPRGPWTFLAIAGRRQTAQTFAVRGEAIEIIEKQAKAGRRLRFLLANTTPINKRAATEADMTGTRYVAVFVPASRRVALDAMPYQPTAIIAVEGGFAAVWRFVAPVPVAVAERVAAYICPRLGGQDLHCMVPLPIITPGVRLVSFEAGRYCLPTDFTLRLRQSRSARLRLALPSCLARTRTAARCIGLRSRKEAKLLNFGVLVTGDPGSGKTQTLNVLIDGVAHMGLPVCIFDFKNDYAERDFVQANGLKVHDVRRHGIPFNPLMPSANEDGQAQPIEHIFTITGVLKRVFGLGDRQTAMLRDAMKEAFERRGIDPQKWADAEASEAAELRRRGGDPRRAEGGQERAGRQRA